MKKLTFGIAALCAAFCLVLAGCDSPVQGKSAIGEDLALGQASVSKEAAAPGSDGAVREESAGGKGAVSEEAAASGSGGGAQGESSGSEDSVSEEAAASEEDSASESEAGEEAAAGGDSLADPALPGRSSGAFVGSVSFANKDKGTVTLTNGTESFTASWSKPFYKNRMDIVLDLPANLELAPSGHTYLKTSVGETAAVEESLRIVDISGEKTAIITNIDPKTWKFTLSVYCSAVSVPAASDFTASVSFANKDKGTIVFTNGTESFTAKWSKPFYLNRMEIVLDLPANIALAPSGRHTYEGFSTSAAIPLAKETLRIHDFSGGKMAVISNIDPKTWKYTLSLSCFSDGV